MLDAIIGESGFVGGILAAQHSFGARFNSSTISGVSGQCFGTVVCAAAPGSMFMANRCPERDRAMIEALIARLSEVNSRSFVLISSIAVLKNFAGGVDEGTREFQQELAYGRHRRLLEAFCEIRFQRCLVVRLPALFGPGLRKNFLFDLMNPVPSILSGEKLKALLAALSPTLRATLKRLYTNDPEFNCWKLDRTALNANSQCADMNEAVLTLGMSATQFHNPNSTYQYYDMRRLWQDISTATRAELNLVHLATAPLRAAEIHARLIGTAMPNSPAQLHLEDIHTRYASLWGCEGHYLEDEGTVLNKLDAFFRQHRTTT